MPLLRWKDHYSVGNAAVDHEHRELIDLINRLHEEMMKQGAAQRTEAFFGDLFRGISAHFALEERFMREHGYDQFPQHKAEHERLLDEIRDIMDDFRDEPEAGSAELAHRLDRWFSHHFETHDSRLHRRLGTHPH